MKTYKAVFHPVSPLEKIPDAQTIFGALCQCLLLTKGIDSLNEYLDSFENEPKLVHSSMFPDHMFPAPKESIVSLTEMTEIINAVPAEMKISLLSDFKKYKKVQYISDSVFCNYFLANKYSELKKQIMGQTTSTVETASANEVEGVSVLKNKDEQISFKCATRQIIRNSSEGNKVEKDKIERELFYQKQTYYSESSNLALYIKTSQEKEELFKLLKCFEIIGIGAKTSIGLNAFDLVSLDEVSFKNENPNCCLLSNCIPKQGEFDLHKSSYSIISNIYRGSKSYIGNGIVGRFNTFGTGSVMRPTEKKEYYGRLVKTEVNGKPLYHYGIGFVL